MVVVVCGLFFGRFSQVVFVNLFAFKVSLGFMQLSRAGFWD